MNRERRNRLMKVIEKLQDLRDEIEWLQMEEQEAFDNLPESLQDSERGEQMYENADNLEDAYSDLDDVVSDLIDILDR